MTAASSWYTLPDFLIREFPQLREEIEEEYFAYMNVTANPMPHFFLADVLLPLLSGDSIVRDDASRRRAGEILDQLLTSSDEDLAEAALLSVWEMIRDSEVLREETSAFLGPISREWLERSR